MTAWPVWTLFEEWAAPDFGEGGGSGHIGILPVEFMGENLPMRGFATRVFRVMMFLVKSDLNHCKRMAHLKAVAAWFSKVY